MILKKIKNIYKSPQSHKKQLTKKNYFTTIVFGFKYTRENVALLTLLYFWESLSIEIVSGPTNEASTVVRRISC
jgi:hypothetical protein